MNIFPKLFKLSKPKPSCIITRANYRTNHVMVFLPQPHTDLVLDCDECWECWTEYLDLIVERIGNCFFAELSIEIFLNFRLHPDNNRIYRFQEIFQLHLCADLSLFNELTQFMDPVIERSKNKGYWRQTIKANCLNFVLICAILLLRHCEFDDRAENRDGLFEVIQK